MASDIKKMLEEAMPGMEVVEVSEPRNAGAHAFAAADSDTHGLDPGPSIEELRRKYLGAPEADTMAADDGAPAADEETVVARIRSKLRAADPMDDPGPRTVIMSPKDGIIGSQG